MPFRNDQAAHSGDARSVWLQSPTAARYGRLADALLAEPLAEVFGRWCVQVGAFAGDRLCAHAGTLRRVVCDEQAGAAVRCAGDQLPFASGMADAVIIAHSLEFARSPHQLLREADRVLSDRGTLFVLAHSPYAPRALAGRVGINAGALPPSLRAVSAGRLADWLELLDFEVTGITRYGSGWPWRRPRADSLLSCWADAYLLVARKRVLPLTPSRPLRRARVGAGPQKAPVVATHVGARRSGESL